MTYVLSLPSETICGAFVTLIPTCIEILSDTPITQLLAFGISTGPINYPNGRGQGGGKEQCPRFLFCAVCTHVHQSLSQILIIHCQVFTYRCCVAIANTCWLPGHMNYLHFQVSLCTGCLLNPSYISSLY